MADNSRSERLILCDTRKIRDETIQLIRKKGGRIRQCFGTRLFIADLGPDVEALIRRLPAGATARSMEDPFDPDKVRLEDSGKKALSALKWRRSASYRRMISGWKERIVPADEILSGPCTDGS